MQREHKPSIDRHTIRFFWAAAMQHKQLALLCLAFPIGSIALYMLIPMYVGKTLAALTQPGHDPWQYLPYILVAVVVGVIGNRVGFIALLRHQAATMHVLQTRALQALLGRSVGFHNNNIGGKLVSDAIDFPAGYNQLGNSLIINLIPFMLLLIVGIVLVAVQSWQLGLIVFAMASYAILAGYFDSKRRSPLRTRRLAATKAVTGHLADTIVNVQTVKTFAREDHELHESDAKSQVLLGMRLSDWGMAARTGNNRIMVLLAFQLILLITTIKLVQQDPGVLAAGIFAFSYTITLTLRLFEINTMLRQIEDGFLQAAPLTEILLGEPEIQDAPGAQALTVKKGAVALDNVHFRYDDSTAKDGVFSELNLQIAPGEKIGLVGPSGGGKSTLTRLLLRFENINDGTITIDGQNIATVTQASLRQAISYVPQEPLLFHRTVRENIAYGRPEATDKQVMAAAESAHAHEFIKDLPDSYDTIVGERGVKLSGGQRQRIAIARAILKDAPILILDEATSALDSESEVLIQQALRQLMQGRTTLVIAHRLSTIQKMDRILVLEHGAITEQGTHAELIKHKGTYAKLWGHQSGGFIED